MADNIVLNSGTGGSTLKTDENASSEHYQIIKLADGTADSDQVIASGSGTSTAALRVELPTDGTGKVGLNAGSATIGEITIGAATTAAGDLAKAEDQAHTSGDVGVMAMGVRKATPANLSGTDGDYEPFQMSAGRLWTSTVGDAAHDAAVSGNPVLLGIESKNVDGTDGGEVAEGDVSRIKGDRAGRVFVSTAHPRGFHVSVDYGASAQTNTTVQAAPGSGVSLFITDICISNGPTAVNNVTLLDGSGGTVKFEAYLAQNANLSHSLRQPIKLTANTLLAVTSSGTTELALNISGYIAT